MGFVLDEKLNILDKKFFNPERKSFHRDRTKRKRDALKSIPLCRLYMNVFLSSVLYVTSIVPKRKLVGFALRDAYPAEKFFFPVRPFVFFGEN